MRYVVVAYDVVSDKRRRRLHKAVDALLPRVQKSVFEGPIRDADLGRLRMVIRRVIDPATDTVRMYHLSAGAVEKTDLFGRAELAAPPPAALMFDEDG